MLKLQGEECAGHIADAITVIHGLADVIPRGSIRKFRIAYQAVPISWAIDMGVIEEGHTLRRVDSERLYFLMEIFSDPNSGHSSNFA